MTKPLDVKDWFWEWFVAYYMDFNSIESSGERLGMSLGGGRIIAKQ